MSAVVVVVAIAAGATWFLSREEPTSTLINAEWQNRESPSGQYLIQFPRDAKRDSRSVSISGITFDIDGLYVGEGGLQRPGIETLFVECDLRAAGVGDGVLRMGLTHGLLEVTAKETFNSLGVEWESPDRIDWVSLGLTFDGVIPEHDLVARMFVMYVEDDLVGAVVITPEAEADGARRYIDRIAQSVTTN